MLTCARQTGTRACSLIFEPTYTGIVSFLYLYPNLHIRFNFKTILLSFSLCLDYSIHHFMFHKTNFASIRTQFGKMTMIPLIHLQKHAPLRQAIRNVQPPQPPKAKVATIHKESSGRISCVAHV